MLMLAAGGAGFGEEKKDRARTAPSPVEECSAIPVTGWGPGGLCEGMARRLKPPGGKSERMASPRSSQPGGTPSELPGEPGPGMAVPSASNTQAAAATAA